MTSGRGTVLLVDDAESVHEVARHFLGGYQLIDAFNGRQALAALEAGEEVDVVLLDVDLPDTSGLILVGKIRLLRPTLPVLMFSADFTPETIALAIQRGATGFLAKWPENFAGVGAGIAAQTRVRNERD